MFLLIDNYDSFTYNLVQAFYALGHKPEVRRNDDPALLDLATSPDLPAPAAPKIRDSARNFSTASVPASPCWASAWATSCWACTPARG